MTTNNKWKMSKSGNSVGYAHR